eukprot:CAMPEP_0113848572 /NCGR_PEP_ID=MMETSP0372-20130328/2565_1 /TAXON_ID=340204 /ORGANISM="Lankesteria abbotti" /LENGTH=147 /DNA_ID=CAMNT_0000818097 /DNA_START=74 /DNA_END=514 /DNA_ORIENTATION=+ /assembly_acc=CAM_ASM_000359
MAVNNCLYLPIKKDTHAKVNQFCCLEFCGSLKESEGLVINEHQGTRTFNNAHPTLDCGMSNEEDDDNTSLDVFVEGMSLNLTYNNSKEIIKVMLRVGCKELEGKVVKMQSPLLLCRPQMNEDEVPVMKVYGVVNTKLSFMTPPMYHW